MGQFEQTIGKALLRRLAPVDESRLLSDEEMAALAPRIRRLDRYGVCVTLMSVGASTVLLTWLLNALDLSVHGRDCQPFYSDRSAVPWFGAGLVFAFIVSYAPVRAFVTWWMEGDVELHDRYEATKNGFDEQRAFLIVVVFLGTLGMLMSFYAWNNGTIVDDSGIRFKAGLVAVCEQDYADVRHIGVYERLVAPIGVLMRPNVRVTFGSGPALEMLGSDNAIKNERLKTVAEFIAERSGIAAEHGDIRPKAP